MIFIQESWLFQLELSLLYQIDSEFEGFGISAIDDTSNIILGRPYGRMSILLRKKFRSIAQFHTYQCSRLLGVQLTCNDVSMLFISVYMPYQCDDNFEMFMEYIGRISALIEESSTNIIAIVGDFNAAIDTQFEAELQEFCNNFSLEFLIICFMAALRESLLMLVTLMVLHLGWLDHVICSQDVQARLHSLAILDIYPALIISVII